MDPDLTPADPPHFTLSEKAFLLVAAVLTLGWVGFLGFLAWSAISWLA